MFVNQRVFVILGAFVATLAVHTVLREMGVPDTYLPLTQVQRVGDVLAWIYYCCGQVIGTVWRWVMDHLLGAIKQTAIDFMNAILPYVDIRQFFEGVKDALRSVWEYVPNIADKAKLLPYVGEYFEA